METAELKDLIRAGYGSIAADAGASSCCAPAASAMVEARKPGADNA